jgi:hypothetical protein
MKDWQPIASAPFDREIQVSVIEKGGVHALIVPCRPMQDGCTCLNPRAIIIDRPMVRVACGLSLDFYSKRRSASLTSSSANYLPIGGQ